MKIQKILTKSNGKQVAVWVNDQSVENDAINELHNRWRGRDNRLVRLAAAGAPTGRDELKNWVLKRLGIESLESIPGSSGQFPAQSASQR